MPVHPATGAYQEADGEFYYPRLGWANHVIRHSTTLACMWAEELERGHEAEEAALYKRLMATQDAFWDCIGGAPCSE